VKVLITGGSGYFGSLLRDRILEKGGSVRVFDLLDAQDRPASVEFSKGDIRDFGALAAACAGCAIVYHCVAQVPLAKDRRLFRSVNVDGTACLLRAARHSGAIKVIYVSSSAVFGVPKSNPVTELTPAVPGEAYGQAKLEAEHLCRRASDEGMDITIIRPRTILGHGRLGIFQILFEWIRTGNNVPVLGDGSNVYQFVHADDLADACILAADRQGSTLYNCGTDRFGTMRGALEALCASAGTGSRVRGVPMAPAILLMNATAGLGLSPLGQYHAMMFGRSFYFDVEKAKRELDWRPKYSNEEMFIQSYAWYVGNREGILASRPSSHHRSPVKQGILSLAKYFL
jgi:nucleoside-diphosphate-sugar epimerase